MSRGRPGAGRELLSEYGWKGPESVDNFPLDTHTNRIILRLAMKQVLSKKRCKAADCRKWFQPQHPAQEYHEKRCKNREGQRKLREMAKIGQAMVERAQ